MQFLSNYSDFFQNIKFFFKTSKNKLKNQKLESHISQQNIKNTIRDKGGLAIVAMRQLPRGSFLRMRGFF
jgi:hypothetical protein